MTRISISVSAVLIVLLSVSAALYADSDKRLEFTGVPPCGAGSDSQGNISGRVDGLEDPETYKVVVYAHTDRWYVQPLESDPFTKIDSEGNWSNWTHLGYRYAALVVLPSFNPPSNPAVLPEGSDVVLSVEASASTECQR